MKKIHEQARSVHHDLCEVNPPFPVMGGAQERKCAVGGETWSCPRGSDLLSGQLLRGTRRPLTSTAATRRLRRGYRSRILYWNVTTFRSLARFTTNAVLQIS